MKRWLCSAVFPRDLKTHLAAPPPDRMRVIRPRCHLEEKCYKSINDRKKHACRQHRLDIKRFTSTKDYIWIVWPTEYHSYPTKMALWAISIWFNRCKRPSRLKNEWIDGWVSYIMDESQHNNPQKRPRLEEPDPYSPTTSSVGDEDIQLDSVQLENGNTRAYFLSEGQFYKSWYEVNLSDNTLQERRYFEYLSRTLTAPDLALGGLRQRKSPLKKIYVRNLCFLPISADAAMNSQPTMPESSNCSVDDQLATPLTLEKPKRVFSMDDQSLSRDVVFPIHGTSDNTIEPENVALYMMMEFLEPVTRSPSMIVFSLNITSQSLISKVTTGCMSLLLPARSDCDKEEIVHFTAGPLSIRWPPRSWKMSAERKLFSDEYAAMTLEASFTPGHILNIDQGYLIDHYNPLVLPGTSFVLTSNPLRKCLCYNCEILRIITVGQDIPGCSRFHDFLEEGAKCRYQSLDSVLPISEKVNVGLRLEP
ncbi:hypothetical protein ACJMK2_040105 [Sinanodonta woodiana]|uniref:Uncharacterized protein n=1 Tax=Sinanodonta woodiana TaxID=1069815 RepID=A0ABD3WHF4_SINWO